MEPARRAARARQRWEDTTTTDFDGGARQLTADVPTHQDALEANTATYF